MGRPGVRLLEWAKAWEILDKTSVLSDEATARVEAAALRVALSSNLPDLRAHLALAVLTADPEGAADRARQAHARRLVTFRPGPDSTGTMALTASAAEVASAEAALNRLTTAAQQADSMDAAQPGLASRLRDATRADVLLDLIHAADDGRLPSPEPPAPPGPPPRVAIPGSPGPACC